jgi:hypothetical protein
MLARLMFPAVFALGLLIAALALRPPAPLAVDAPAERFSAERAMVDVRAGFSRPHPTGTPENAAVRDWLVRRLGELGLETRVQRGQAASTWRGRDGQPKPVENVVGLMPGTDRTAPALLLMSHYDTAPGSPGAADDGAGVSSMLEIARALRAGPPPRRDVIFLFTDGEEAGLLGANVFFESDALRTRVGAVVNLEARGSAGRVVMFETGPDNAPWIHLWRKAARSPTGNSLTGFVYDNMPNGTDFSVPKGQGIGGLNFAFIGREVDYHTPSATPERLSRRSLQHMGSEGLAAARALARAPALPQGRGNAVYFDVLGRFVVAYPPVVGWALVAFTAALVGWSLRRARVLGRASWGDVARGFALFPLTAAWSALALRLLERLLWWGGGEDRRHALLAQADSVLAAYVAGLAGAALLVVLTVVRGRGRLPLIVAAAAAGIGCLFGGFDALGTGLAAVAALAALVPGAKPANPWGLWMGVLAAGLFCAGAVQAAAPALAFLFTWPVLVAAAAAAVLLVVRPELAAAPILAASAAGMLAFAPLAYVGQQVFVAVGFQLAPALAVFAALSVAVLFPSVWLFLRRADRDPVRS